MDLDNIIPIVALAIWLIQLVAKAVKKRAPEPVPVPELPIPELPFPAEPEPVPPVAHKQGDGALGGALVERARELAHGIRHERRNRRFVPVLTEWIPGQAEALGRDVRDRLAGPDEVAGTLAALELVIDEVSELVRQRRDQSLGPLLGDADALADACYRPVVEFARAEGLGLTSNEPATRLSPFDLAIWTGFIPTSVAPIFLPPGFGRDPIWWPALAHEIGHDFLASIPELDLRLREEIGIAPERVGTRPLAIGAEGLTLNELARVMGAWFEEVFCDTFGTLMCGPGYVASMLRLFAASEDVREITVVYVDRSGARYDIHPPRHLRLIAACQVLTLAGLGDDARRLRAAWDARHTSTQGDGTPPDRILFPVAGAYLAVPLEPLERLVEELVSRLYTGPLAALGGVGLSDVSGLDFGPHENQEAIRVAEALAQGRIPTAVDPRVVVAGAALAALDAPEQGREIMERVRAAIPGRDSGEKRPDAYGSSQAPPRAAPPGAMAGGRITTAELMDAIVFREVLAPRHRRPFGRGSRL